MAVVAAGKLRFNLTKLDEIVDRLPICGCMKPAPTEGCITDLPASIWALSDSKRGFDIAISILALTACAIPMLLIAICVRLTSPGKAFFSQDRVGRGGCLFRIYKFRSMDASSGRDPDLELTKEGDRRITPLGRWLRKLKLDELPQFYNVLRGDMSLVGPRPKLLKYETLTNMPYRPGITGVASIAFRREEELLRDCEPCDLEQFYATHIKPLKANLDVCYMCKATPVKDARVIATTFLACVAPNFVSSIGVQPIKKYVGLALGAPIALGSLSPGFALSTEGVAGGDNLNPISVQLGA